MMIRALIAAGLLLIGGGNAFAGTCSSVTGSTPGVGLPSGDTFITAATGVTPDGSLNGSSGTGYPLCTSGSTFLIPFYLSAPSEISINVAEADIINPDGTYFDLTVNGVDYVQSPIPTTQLGSDFLEVGVPGGVSTLGITDLYQQLNGMPATDTLSVSIQFNNFIPEPATMSLLGFGAICLGALRRRRHRPA